MKQANLHRSDRPIGLSANWVNESGVASSHADSSDVDHQIPRGIAMLIDILAREALKDVIAEHRKLQPRAEEREETAQSGKPNETAIAGPPRYKDQILSTARPAPDRFIPTKSDRYKDQIGFVGSGGRI